jgi:hypothetical protein
MNHLDRTTDDMIIRWILEQAIKQQKVETEKDVGKME